MPVLLSSITSSGGVKAIHTGLVSTLTRNPAETWDHTVYAPEQWIANVTIPAVVVAKSIILLSGSLYVNGHTFFRRPAAARFASATQIRIFASRGIGRDLTGLGYAQVIPPAVLGGSAHVPLGFAVSEAANVHDIQWTVVEYF